MTYKECQDKPQTADSHPIRIVHCTVLFMGGQLKKMFGCFTWKNDFFIKKSGWKRLDHFSLKLHIFICLNKPAKPQVLAKTFIYLALAAVLVCKAQQSSDKRSPLALS